MMNALQSFARSKHAREGPFRRFRSHCAATLSSWYLDQWTNGLEGSGAKTWGRKYAWANVCETAHSGSAAAADALYSIFYALWPASETGPGKTLALISGRALRGGMEFILRELMEHDVPGKAQFLELFTTRLCRGAGLVVGSPSADVPLTDPPDEALFACIDDGVHTPEVVFRIAVTWGRFAAARAILELHKPDVDGQDENGETALLRACRAGHFELACWLLATAKAKPSISTRSGVTPLHWLHVFPEDQVQPLAALLRTQGADANAIAADNGSNVENHYWFFRGPPLIRAVASGNEAAVRALLDIGADPLLPIRPGEENAVVFAARRLRASILWTLLDRADKLPVWEVSIAGGTLLSHAISCPAEYAAKVHGRSYEKAWIDTFDLLWNRANRPHTVLRLTTSNESTEKRMFRSITKLGQISIQVAVEAGNMLIARRLLELCGVDEDGNSTVLALKVANVGLQSAVLYEKAAMVEYFLSRGAHSLQPAYYIHCGRKIQEPPKIYADPSAWNINDLNQLHQCAKAGGSASVIGQLLIDHLKPDFETSETAEQRNTRQQCAVEITWGGDPPFADDPLLDRRDGSDETPFFTALLNEEYEYAFYLRDRGADKNALVRGGPIINHLPNWSPVQARTALLFLIRDTWGHLRVPRRLYLNRAIAASADWPREQAADFVNDILGAVSPRHDHETTLHDSGYRTMRIDRGPVNCGCSIDWDLHIFRAAEALHAAALAELVRRRPKSIEPNDSLSPINALRRMLLEMEVPKTLEGRRERFRRWGRVVEMLHVLQQRYPNHRFDTGKHLTGIAENIVRHVRSEMVISKTRLVCGAVSPSGFVMQACRLLEPFLAVAAGCADEEVSMLRELIQGLLPAAANIEVTVRRRDQAMDGLEMTMIRSHGDKVVEDRVEAMFERLDLNVDLDCEYWT